MPAEWLRAAAAPHKLDAPGIFAAPASFAAVDTVLDAEIMKCLHPDNGAV